MKNNIIYLSAIVAGMLLIFSCGKDDEPGDGGNGGGTTLSKITITDVSKFEGNASTTFDFKVRLDNASTESVRVDFATNELAAKAGEDFIAQNGTIIFDGSIEEIITIEIVTDTLKEADEDFEVVLSNPTNGTLEKSKGTGIIRNEDTFLAGSDDGYITPEAYAGMTLVWQDEFNGTEINSDNWTHEIGTGDWGWGNNELQYYTERTDNSYISNGKLVIEAKAESFSGSDYTSARMVTFGKQEFIYGRIDVRAKLPEGQGLWPAIWMLGNNIYTDGWPFCGEIDIMELVGHEPSKIHGTAHFGLQPPSDPLGGSYSLGAEKYIEEFHVFSIIWEEDQIKWLMDDNQFHSITKSQIGSVYPFNNNFFFILNVAVGGQWPGSPDATTTFPQRMLVDYIRVFQ